MPIGSQKRSIQSRFKRKKTGVDGIVTNPLAWVGGVSLAAIFAAAIICGSNRDREEMSQPREYWNAAPVATHTMPTP